MKEIRLSRATVVIGGILLLAVVAGAFLVSALLVNIVERKREAATRSVMLVDVTENDTDPAKWGINWPRQYELYKKTALPTKTRFGGHGGSEALPTEKIERDPWLRRMFGGYAFAIDYRDRRGHFFMLDDQEASKRLDKPQSGSCLHCHASIMPLYRELGKGDAIAGLDSSYKYSYRDLNKKLHGMGHAHPVSCVDCHESKTMRLRVTRPGFIKGIRELAASGAAVKAFPSVGLWRNGARKTPYDPNAEASHTEMRSFVCAQCHVEYYCASKMPLTYPWGKGLASDSMEAYWNSVKFDDGHRFYDFKQAETGAEILKAQHPEFELWSQGVHAKSGVACADCHMPYMRDGASKVSDHWVRSPLLNINRACQVCHHFSENEIADRVASIQDNHYALQQRAAAALMNQMDAILAAKGAGVDTLELDTVLELQRKAQWRLDFVAAENSMGFHAPQEAARILAEAIDYARQGQALAIALMYGK